MIDWAVFDQYPENTVECRCGTIYRSHSKTALVFDRLQIHCRKSCPGCGDTVGNALRVSSDPEEFVIRKEDT